MTCAHSDGWFGVPSEWKADDNARLAPSAEWAHSDGTVEPSELRIIGRCRIFAPHFDSGTECAEGLVVETCTGNRFGLYWAKPSRTFQLVPLRERAP